MIATSGRCNRCAVLPELRAATQMDNELSAVAMAVVATAKTATRSAATGGNRASCMVTSLIAAWRKWCVLQDAQAGGDEIRQDGIQSAVR